MSNSVNMISKKIDGETGTRKITHVNPNAADSDVALFVANLSTLSQDTLTGIEKVEVEDMQSYIHTMNTNTQSDVTLKGTAEADDMLNIGNNVSIGSGEGDDTITNTGDRVSIDSGKGDDTIINTGNRVKIVTWTGADSVLNTGDNATISSNNDDTITNTGDGVSICAATGINSGVLINNSGDNVKLDLDEGNHSVNNSGDGVYVSVWPGSDFDGSEMITNTGKSVTIKGSPNNDSIYNTSDRVSIYSGKGDDTITNNGDSVCIDASSGNDTVASTGDYVTIYASGGFNSIKSVGDNTLVSITVSSAESDCDTIDISGSNNTVYIYSGTTLINSATDTSVLMRTIQDVPMTLSATDLSQYTNVSIHGRASADIITNYRNNTYIYGQKEKDTITNYGSGVTIDGGAGNDSIKNYGDNTWIGNRSGSNRIINHSNNSTIRMDSIGINYITLEGASNTSVILYDNNKYGSTLYKVNLYNFNQASDTILLPSTVEASINDTLSNDSDTAIAFYHGASISTAILYGITSGTVRVRPDYENSTEVKLFNINNSAFET